MKRITKPFAVLATLALSVTAFQGVVAAQETKTVDPKVSGTVANSQKDDKALNPPITPANEKNKPAVNSKKVDIKVTETDDYFKVQLKDVKEAKGTWTMLAGGQEIHSAQAGTSFTFYTFPRVWDIIEETGGNSLEFRFEGTSNGTPIKSSFVYKPEAGLSRISPSTEVKDGKLYVTATLKSYYRVEGHWSSVVSKTPEFKKEDIIEYDMGPAYGKYRNFILRKLEPGNTYYVRATLNGTIDDKKKVISTTFKVTMPKKDTASTGTQTDPVKPISTGTQTDPVKPIPVATTNPVTNENAKKEVKKEGGHLPKTATSYPIAMVGGAAALMVGAGLFFVVRRRKQNQQ
ncbi:LPXTG-motif cell wall anchor domain-containing protein [Thermoactinomyces sp. DSM 45891]|uniref:LPXTG cell wall anchor domain-containing protein n=1 Tax=Thermoactinomyces sp. DSM 45891 TaxID=1761907 RepID=UPI000919BDAD|nr:LPXTG cell wall anchor domain-containing protein [Thermoactinomyces sp. DSM 45891]SFX11998.1 LPXTG-motif cell wall anchor domain-containing protein [Thermoactinomyces sp. DSM 45891]